MNQLLTKNGKPIINRVTKLPIHTLPVDLRVKIIKKALGLSKKQSKTSNLTSFDDRWDMIRNECKYVLNK